MDKLEFRIGTEYDEQTKRTYEFIQIYINGTNLIELIENHDAIYYPGNTSLISEMYHKYLYENLKYDRIHKYYGDNMKVILACSCGDNGCGSVRINAIETDNTVIWKDMMYGYEERIYNFSEFVFDRKQYEEQLEFLRVYTTNKQISDKLNNK